MRFRCFREFVVGKVDEFVKKDLASCMKDLFAGLSKLSFEDNFESFTVEVKMQAGEEVTIGNKLSSPPTKWLTVRQTGNGVLTDGTYWSADKVSIKNNGSVVVTATIIFMR